MLTLISTASKDQEKQFQDVITQQASLINRRKGMFLEAAKEASIKLVTKFDIKDLASLKAEMPMEQIRMLKRAFKDSFGFDVLGSEKELRDYFGKLSMPFEGRVYTTSGDDPKEVHFVRVVNIGRVVTQMLDGLTSSNLLCPIPNVKDCELYLLLTGDKDGSTTKLMLQTLNSDRNHSVRAAKLIGIYEGEKENRERIEHLLGPVIKELQTFSKKCQGLSFTMSHIFLTRLKCFFCKQY